MTQSTATANDTALSDPIISLLTRWKAANDLFNSKSDDDSEEWARETYGRYEGDMDCPPKATTAAGALAALNFAMSDQAINVNGYAAPFVKRSYQFMTRFLSGPDPIFAAIAEHKRLWLAINDANDNDTMDKLSDIEAAYLDGMLRMAPATVPGLLAWLDYVLSESGIRESDPGRGMDAVRETLREFAARHLGGEASR